MFKFYFTGKLRRRRAKEESIISFLYVYFSDMNVYFYKSFFKQKFVCVFFLNKAPSCIRVQSNAFEQRKNKEEHDKRLSFS